MLDGDGKGPYKAQVNPGDPDWVKKKKASGNWVPDDQYKPGEVKAKPMASPGYKPFR